MQFLDRYRGILVPLAAGLALALVAGTLAFGPWGRPTRDLPWEGRAVVPTSDLSAGQAGAAAGESLAGRLVSSLSSRGGRSVGMPAGDSLPASETQAAPTVSEAPPVASNEASGAPSATSAGPAKLLSRGPVAGLRVGIQSGHWKTAELPEELRVLRGSTGAQGKGWTEMGINLDISRRVAKLLEGAGVQVDLLPATVPPGYKADAFVSIHGDANSNTSVSGFKTAGARWSVMPDKDNALVRAINSEYQAATGLKEHPNTITENMRQYYAFNWRSFQHSVDPSTPAVLLEMGFLTTPGDLKLLQQEPDRVAEAVARGILKFLVP